MKKLGERIFRIFFRIQAFDTSVVTPVRIVISFCIYHIFYLVPFRKFIKNPLLG